MTDRVGSRGLIGVGSIIGGMVFLTPLAAFALLMASHMWTVGITRLAFILLGTTSLFGVLLLTFGIMTISKARRPPRH
jgi:1,4-dihydroxy-2-naphthoate octaprenyltransferase